jgi:hypothetical protein
MCAVAEARARAAEHALLLGLLAPPEEAAEDLEDAGGQLPFCAGVTEWYQHLPQARAQTGGRLAVWETSARPALMAPVPPRPYLQLQPWKRL